MNHTRVKICGITTSEHARHAASSGADAIGLVFHEKSPRHVTPVRADEICRQLPAFVTTVALFQDASEKEVINTLERVAIDLLQFHGGEQPSFCRQFNKPYIKAIAMGMAMGETLAATEDTTDLYRAAEAYHDARGLVLDGHAPGEDGGTGKSFDWDKIPDDLALPVILAGGLNANNVAEAIRIVQPYAVDVSSGVESEKGIKDADKISAFIKAVKVK